METLKTVLLGLAVVGLSVLYIACLCVLPTCRVCPACGKWAWEFFAPCKRCGK